jgi:hypothetical protein
VCNANYYMSEWYLFLIVHARHFPFSPRKLHVELFDVLRSQEVNESVPYVAFALHIYQ